MSATRIERHGRVAEIVLNRPEKLNAFNRELFTEFERSVQELGRDNDVSVILVRGEGRAFSVGWDLSSDGYGTDSMSLAQHDTYADWASLARDNEVFRSVFDCPKPVVVSVHGYCMGGAIMLASFADITVVGEETTIGWPIMPMGGGMIGAVAMWTLGSKKAREMSYIAGSSLKGAELVSLGWANHAVPEDQVLAKARELADDIARTPRDMLQIKKAAINRVLNVQGFRTAVEFGVEWDAIIHASPGNQMMLQKVRELGLKGARDWLISDDSTGGN
jgi:enoyl-CoA hydratase